MKNFDSKRLGLINTQTHEVDSICIMNEDWDDVRHLQILWRNKDKVNPPVHHLLIHPYLLLACIMGVILICDQFTTWDAFVWHTFDDEHGWQHLSPCIHSYSKHNLLGVSGWCKDVDCSFTLDFKQLAQWKEYGIVDWSMLMILHGSFHETLTIINSRKCFNSSSFSWKIFWAGWVASK